MIDEEEKHIVTTNMEEFGGSFIKALAEAIRRADHRNYEKIKNAFPEYWKKYYNNRKLMKEE